MELFFYVVVSLGHGHCFFRGCNSHMFSWSSLCEFLNKLKSLLFLCGKRGTRNSCLKRLRVPHWSGCWGLLIGDILQVKSFQSGVFRDLKLKIHQVSARARAELENKPFAAWTLLGAVTGQKCLAVAKCLQRTAICFGSCTGTFASWRRPFEKQTHRIEQDWTENNQSNKARATNKWTPHHRTNNTSV